MLWDQSCSWLTKNLVVSNKRQATTKYWIGIQSRPLINHSSCTYTRWQNLLYCPRRKNNGRKHFQLHYGLIHHSLLPQGNGLSEKQQWQKNLLYPGLFPYLPFWEVAFWPFLWGRICLYKVKVLVAQSCLTLCYPMNYSPSGCAVHGILQARILEWLDIPFSRGSSWPREPGIEPASPALQADYLPSQPPEEPVRSITG